MKIQKALAAISFIAVYRIVSIFGMASMLGIIIHSCFKPDTPAKVFVIFLAALGLFVFVILSLPFVVNSLKQKDEKITTSQKGGTTE